MIVPVDVFPPSLHLFVFSKDLTQQCNRLFIIKNKNSTKKGKKSYRSPTLICDSSCTNVAPLVPSLSFFLVLNKLKFSILGKKSTNRVFRFSRFFFYKIVNFSISSGSSFLMTSNVLDSSIYRASVLASFLPFLVSPVVFSSRVAAGQRPPSKRKERKRRVQKGEEHTWARRGSGL